MAKIELLKISSIHENAEKWSYINYQFINIIVKAFKKSIW